MGVIKAALQRPPQCCHLGGHMRALGGKHEALEIAVFGKQTAPMGQ